MENIIEEILQKLNKNKDDIAINKWGNRHSSSWHKLLEALLIGGNILNASKLLGYSNNCLEQYMRRHISLLFKSHIYRGKWKNTLLRYIDKKQCTFCLKIKDSTFFTTDNSKFDGLNSKCTLCYNIYFNTHVQKYREANIEKIREYGKKHYICNRAYYIAKAAKRRAAEIKATPRWANNDSIRKIYENCPKDCHVDHIIPLKNNIVCGLHCEFNLQYLSIKDNLIKSNKFNIED